MRDPKKEAMRMLRYWLRQCNKLGVNINGVNTKENEGEKRTSPLHPSLEKRAKQENPPPPPARAREEKKPGKKKHYAEGIPTWDDVLDYATEKKIPLDFAKQWFDLMGEQHWLHPRKNGVMDCWWSYLRSWYRNRHKYGMPQEGDNVAKEEFHSTALEELMPWLK